MTKFKNEYKDANRCFIRFFIGQNPTQNWLCYNVNSHYEHEQSKIFLFHHFCLGLLCNDYRRLRDLLRICFEKWSRSLGQFSHICHHIIWFSVKKYVENFQFSSKLIWLIWIFTLRFSRLSWSQDPYHDEILTCLNIDPSCWRKLRLIFTNILSKIKCKIKNLKKKSQNHHGCTTTSSLCSWC